MTYPGLAAEILHKVAVVQLNSTGSGVITLTPSMGEYWAPLIIRVATKATPPPQPSCVVYHGAIGVRDQTTYLDDTNLANNDTTSICAGVTVQFGEAISVVFSGGLSGDIATVIVDGMLTNTPPNLGLFPQVPGTHFAGKNAGESITLISSSVGSGIIIPTGTVSVSYIDVRQFASYYLQIDATTSSNPATAFNPVSVSLFWAANSAGGTLMDTDFAEFYADNQNGLPISLGTFTKQDIMHGPFMAMSITNMATVDSVSVTWRLFGTTRTIPLPRALQRAAFDGLLLDKGNTAIPATSIFDNPTPFSYGRHLFQLQNNGPGVITVNVIAGSSGGIDTYNVAAAAIDRREFIMPKHALNFQVQTGATNSNFNCHVTTLFDKN